MYSLLIKPVGDFFISLILIIILSPIIIFISILLFFSNNGKVFFYQLRAGLETRTFKIIKFKTMIDAFDENGNLLPDNIRLTRVGRIVRSTSLDELPQLVNVLKGEMSLVGPRPLLIEYLPLYNTIQLKRHNVKPGITGLAQTNGRNAISWDEKFKLDIKYVDNLSFFMDINILINTFIVVILQKGIKMKNTETNIKFKGN